MKILHLAYEFPPPWEELNIPVYELVKEQAREGDTVTVFCGGWPKPAASPDPNLKVYRLPRGTRHFSLFLTTAPLAFLAYLGYRLTHRIDVVHGHNHLPACFHLYRFLFGWLDRTPYVLHLHGTAAGRRAKLAALGEKPSFWARFFEWPLHHCSDWLGCRVARMVICSSNSVRDEAVTYYHADPRRAIVISDGVNLLRFNPHLKDLRGPLGLHNKKVILYVGGIHRRGRLDLLIEALAKMPEEFVLLAIGRQNAVYFEKVVERIQSLKLEKRVTFKDEVDYRGLSPYFATADVFVYPATYEGSSRVTLEAIACGLPVVISGMRIDEPHLKKAIVNFESNHPADLALMVVEAVASKEAHRIDAAIFAKEYGWPAKAAGIKVVYEVAGREKKQT